MVFVTLDGKERSFRGTYLEVEPPTRIVQTWLFEGRPAAKTVETGTLKEADGVTKLTVTMAFRDRAGCDHIDQARLPGVQLRQAGELPDVTAR
jgi:uncharacterized protein YndB with AHSA1/START domain